VTEDVWAEWLKEDWDRRRWIRHMQDLVARYQAMVDGPGPSLIFRHPTAFREARAQDENERRARLTRAEEELRRLRAGAPLPAPERPRRLLHATADVAWRMRELRVLRRFRSRPDPFEVYRGSERTDPLPASPVAVEAWFALPPSGRLPVALQVAQRRIDVRGLARWLFEGPSARVSLGPESEFGTTPRQIEIDGEIYVVVQHGEGWAAVDGVCPHRGGLLGEGEVEDGCIVCPIHFWKFSLEDGRAVVGRGGIQVHRVEREDGRLYLYRSDG